MRVYARRLPGCSRPRMSCKAAGRPARGLPRPGLGSPRLPCSLGQGSAGEAAAALLPVSAPLQPVSGFLPARAAAARLRVPQAARLGVAQAVRLRVSQASPARVRPGPERRLRFRLRLSPGPHHTTCAPGRGLRASRRAARGGACGGGAAGSGRLAGPGHSRGAPCSRRPACCSEPAAAATTGGMRV